jgi:uncharacterized protein (TIGR03382 family)
MRRPILALLCSIAVAAAFAPLGGDDAYGASGTWNKGTGNWIWQDAGNWSASPPPGVGDTATFGRIDWARPIAIDMKGSSYNFQQIAGNYNGSVEVFYDSDFLTPNADPLGTNSNVSTLENFTIVGPHGSLVEAANASPTLTVEDLRFNKEHRPVFYMPVVIADELWPTEHQAMYFYGDVTAGRITEARNNGWGTSVNFKSDLTVGSIAIPDRTDAAQEVVNVDGVATVGSLNGIGGTANFNDLALSTELRQNNDSVVNIGGRYSGTATYAKDGGAPSINLLSGSTLAPGTSIGTLGGTALSVNVAGGSSYEWEVGASPASSTPGAGWDLSLADVFDVDGPLSFQIVEFGLTESISPSDEFAVLGANAFDLAGIDLSTQVSFGVVPDQATWDISGAQLSFVANFADLDGIAGNEDALVLSGISARFATTVIPEPSAAAIWALGLLALAWYGRRRR